MCIDKKHRYPYVCVCVRERERERVRERGRERELCFVLGVRGGYDTVGEAGKRVGIYIGNRYHFPI